MRKRLETPRRSGVGRPPEGDPARQAALRAFVHDVINPLAAIRISTGALRARTTPIDGDLSHINRIEEAAEAIIRLVTTLPPPADASAWVPVETAVIPSVDLHVLCCEMATRRRFTDGTVIHCRAFGDPRGDWDREQVAKLLSGLIDCASTHLGWDAQMTIAVTGLARHVRAEIHGLRGSSGRVRETSLDVSPMLRGAPAGASIRAIASRNGGILLRLSLPRRNLAAKGREDTDTGTVETT